MGNSAVFVTSDLGAAAYANMKGLEIESVKKQGTRYVYSLRDPERIGEKLKIEYVNSDCRKFDAAIRTLKKLCHAFNN